jgi:hypothetical protein
MVYARSSATGSFDAARGADVTVVATARMSLDVPGNGASLQAPFAVAGWAIDLAAANGAGVDAVHVWAQPSQGPAIFLGVANYGSARADVGGIYGSRFANCAFNLMVSSLPQGIYTVSAYAHSSVSNTFDNVASATVTVR